MENTTRQVSALAVRVELPLSLIRKYSAEPRLARIRKMNNITKIFNGNLALVECSPAGRQ
ncbi:MAG: hypothetical protein JWN94_77 [Betaproteobacteria bacterium]|nr:hypothetical protein [Betaproteobacteria bacterium]